jgi:hypothetical protein
MTLSVIHDLLCQNDEYRLLLLYYFYFFFFLPLLRFTKGVRGGGCYCFVFWLAWEVY